MRPARSRRVQAQRKFAQGAYMPPTAVAVVTTDTRQNAVQDPNVTITKVSATSLLDTVSMQGLHTHMQPVVLVERLLGRNPSSDMPPRPAPPVTAVSLPPPPSPTPHLPPPPLPRPTTLSKHLSTRLLSNKKKDNKRVHTMSLRSKRMSKTAEFKKIVNASSTARKAMIKRKLPDNTKKSPLPKKRNISDSCLKTNSEFSVEDNRPLTYFATCSSTPKAQVPVEVPAVPSSAKSTVRPANPTKEVTPRQSLEEPVAGPSGMQSLVASQSSSSEKSYSLLQHKIQSWLMSASLDDIRLSRSDDGLEEAVMTQLEGGVPVPCIAQKWRSVQDVINAPKEELDSRCQQCRPCIRIKKLMKLSALLKTQVKIDLTNGTDTQSQNGNDENDETMVSPDADQGHLYLDLLPKHPSVMMKLRIHMVHGKELMSACLIPRNDSRKNKQEFLLQEQEHLLDQLIETLTISLNDKSDNHRVSISSIESIDGSDFAIPSGRENEERVRLERRKVRQQKLASAKKRMADTNNMHARLQQEKLKQILRLEAQKNSIKKEVNRIQEQVNRLEEENGAVIAPLRTEVTEKLRAEVDRLSRALEKEKADTDADQCSENNAPSTSACRQTPEGGGLVDAPVFRPTKEEFNDPIEYFEKIWPEAVKYGICKVVPPEGWNPKCRINEDLRFDVSNQYISRLFSRWGPAARELSAIRLCLQQQKVNYMRPPLLDGVEVNLPKLYHLVQRHGGLETVINKKRWGKVADEMKFARNPVVERKLDLIYVKYLLPYDTLTNQERQGIMRKVEKAWNKKNQKLLDRAMNPLHRQKRMLGLSDTSDDETEDEDAAVAVSEAEDCITKGVVMNPPKFKRVATNVYDNIFGQGTAASEPPPLEQIEEHYWRNVYLGTEHLCVHTAAIDTGEEGHGFTKNKNEALGRHPWNLKMISQNPKNILRYLGPVLGVTVPTLHLGMMFSTSCWHKDPHTLPWKEYQHSGPTRIWYGIASEQTDNFRMAVETLCPTSCQNKGLWLSTDIAMIPPQVLRERNVSLSRVTQEAGEFILAFPKAYTCCISTGYTESESVYFAPVSWLENVHEAFQEARESCEPTMFSLEQLLYQIGKDSRTDATVLTIVQPIYDNMLRDEVTNRQMLQERGLTFVNQNSSAGRRKRAAGAYNARDHDECEFCRATLFLSKVKGLTGKNSSLCLEHALKLMDTGRYGHKEISQSEVHVFVTIKELNNVGDDIKRRLGNQTDSQTGRIKT